ncbi:UDP-N-acetylglucosamine 1-carboxyvinyltransferase [Candidatus Uabimicrobium amorphum]|uniref:UDP-N-acetylglucosamine 1-carboxyvinyltransferase n=1 Tax=Uabimicrobium amorphum TaxID=2596890 RepID=A0A5S9IPV8_UABAM|nr:UDP-N-acetylglucosamine 1-carboxyvinyltransferase [Candidatus Uabimicrobium amorphum]BBM85271.1 UDP-N-acetylglucosamine1-carboxyvinyltransferase [Candidatus Uabimicrobium amorphum]
MKSLCIKGGKPLCGTVKISGAKNAALPILASVILSRGTSVIHNVPRLSDVNIIIKILHALGVDIYRREDEALVCTVKNESCCTPPCELVQKMRASICVMGPLLAKRQKAKIAFPGGCVIGERPIDLHLKGMQYLGAHVETKDSHVELTSEFLCGAKMFLGSEFGSTVLGTANVMMAASLAEGTTVIENAAREPEVEELAKFLNQMGAKISGLGTNVLTIQGVAELHGTEYRIISDRIEAGTFIIAAAMTRGRIELQNVSPLHLACVITTLKRIGVTIVEYFDRIVVEGNNSYSPTQVCTKPYPGFPTDLQAQLASMLAIVLGKSCITEKIYPQRFAYVNELVKMGASIEQKGASVYIQGGKTLKGATVFASDLRASAALVLAGLVAIGETTIKHIHHLERGYENLQAKLSLLGADIMYK